MNLDGSPGVDVDLSAGGRLGWLTPLAWSLGLLGGALILGSALLVVSGARPPGPRSARGVRPQAPGPAGPPPGLAWSASGRRPARHAGDSGRRAGPAAEPWALAGQVVPGDPALRGARAAVAGLRGAHRGGVLRDPGHRPLPAWLVRPQRRHPAVDLAGAVLRDGCDRPRPLPAVPPRAHPLPR